MIIYMTESFIKNETQLLFPKERGIFHTWIREEVCPANETCEYKQYATHLQLKIEQFPTSSTKGFLL